MNLAPDCNHYRGDRPCRYRQRCRCAHYAPRQPRIVILKLGALGDVVRTACLLPTLKELYPESHITWVSKPNGVRILRGHPRIDRLRVFDAETMLTLPQQRFDLVLSLDKEPGPTALCNALVCDDKRGIGLSEWGTPVPLTDACEPYFELGLDDDLKFHHNRKAYPQLIHEALGLPYLRRPYRLYPSGEALRRASERFAPWRAQAPGPLVGLNTGAGSVFANKTPGPARWVAIGRALLERGCSIVLLGGREEAAANARIADRLDGPVYDVGADNTEPEFVALVGRCDVVVTGDTFALHAAVARRVPVVALFGPTCPQEIDLFDLGRKLVAPVDCAPCYRRRCDRVPSCMDALPVPSVVDAVEALCRRRTARQVAS
ncbi:MAG: glycosyltransferase family 9 protein [Planctomycetota bacterium]